MEAAFPVAQSGLRATQTRHDVTAHDVANINTDGFEERSVVQADDNPGTRVAAIRKTPNPGPYSNTDLAEESKEMIVNKKVYGANARVFRVQDQMLGEAIDLVG